MKRIILVDGNSLMYRAYYGMAANGNLTTNSKGLYTNAIYAFARMMNTLTKEEYDNILVAFDKGKKTFRHDLMPDYKGGRAPMPDELRMQISYIKQFLEIMRIKQHEVALYEADDIIGTMAKRAEASGFHVDIYSSDKDLLQLITDNITVHLTKKGITDLEDFDPAKFKEKYEIDCTQFRDLKALMGDPSDNISGVPGVGQKSGVKLLKEYGNIEGIIEHKDEIKGALGEKIKVNINQARLCLEMVTINCDSPIEITLEDTERKNPDEKHLIEFYQELEFNSLLRELSVRNNSINQSEDIIEYKIIDNPIDVKNILLNNSSLIFETCDYNYHKTPLLGIGLRNTKGTFIIPSDLIYQSIDLQLFFSDASIKKSIFDYKRAYVILKRLGFDLEGVDFDLLLATYILNPSVAKEEFKVISNYYQYNDVFYDEEIYGRGAKKIIPAKDIIYKHIARKVKCLDILKKDAISRLKDKNQYQLLSDIEIPLSRVLGKMEFNGFKIDKLELKNQEEDLASRISKEESIIKELAGCDFNISSPKQLGEILFEKLCLPCPKKTKTGYSTDIEVLKAIKNSHPIVEHIINFRQLTKLNSTYVSGLRPQIFEDDKVHTIFQQALTQTGRLSSVEPNLQNIPIRTEEGHNVRKLFIPNNKNNSLFSSDYSQIELRVLAHMANVKLLKEAFINGEDIHSETAKKIFGKEEITSLDRRRAKAVNFGIVYGISAFGLAQDVDISNYEAANFIKKYFEIYPEIKEFMDNTIELCKKFGYVKTLKNRIRYIPDINSKIYQQREFAKRTAMNAPIQGSAADIIKIAMIKIDQELEERKLKSKMLVQVHDELVFEVENGEEEILKELVVRNMENAIKLDVPLIVDYSFGSNWYEVK